MAPKSIDRNAVRRLLAEEDGQLVEVLGFSEVYDYAPGKKNWGSYGLPHEGTNVPVLLAGDIAHRDVPTCTLADRLADVRERVRAAEWDTCIVVNEREVVLGRLGRQAIAADTDES